MRGAHAALSANFGAPATPAPWQTLHTESYVPLPEPAPPPAFAGAAAGGGMLAAATAGVAVAGAAAGGGAFGSNATFATGAMRCLTAASETAAWPFMSRF